MTDLSMPAALRGSSPPERRLVAAGAIRRRGARTTHITATAAGISGRITPTRACPDCRGRGGHIRSSRTGRVITRYWIRCTTCYGTGRRA